MSEINTENIKQNENGEIKGFGRTFILFGTDNWYYLKKKIESLIGPAVNELFYLAGKEAGQKAAERIKKFSKKTGINGFRYYVSLGKVLGWGVFKIIKEKPLILRSENSFIAKEYLKHRASEKPICDFVSGFAAGSASVFLKREINIRELKCIAKGDKYCEFVENKK